MYFTKKQEIIEQFENLKVSAKGIITTAQSVQFRQVPDASTQTHTHTHTQTQK